MDSITRLLPEMDELCSLKCGRPAIFLVETKIDSFYVCSACMSMIKIISNLVAIVNTKEELRG